MTDIENLKHRVEAAKATIAHHDAGHNREVTQLKREITELKKDLESQQVAMEASRATVEKLQGEKHSLATEGRRLKEMLLTLLMAVESRRGEEVLGALEDVGQHTAEIIAVHSRESANPDKGNEGGGAEREIKGKDEAHPRPAGTSLSPEPKPSPKPSQDSPQSIDPTAPWNLTQTKEETAR